MDKKIWSWLEGMEAAPTAAIPSAPTATPAAPTAAPVAPMAEPTMGATGVQPTLDVPAGDKPAAKPGDIPTPDLPPEGEAPEAPKEDNLELLDFDSFRDEYIDATVNEKPDALLEKLDQLRGIVDLGPKERKFLNDNIHILLLMREQEIYDASRKLHRVELALDLVSQLSETLDKTAILNEVPIKLPSFFGMKADLYRKFVAALCGGVQIGSGATVEDIVISPTKGQRHLISTRFYTDFGSIEIIPWTLSPGDPELFLKDIERERLQNGSPEEKNVLLKRVILASISKLIKGRVFLICLLNPSTGKRTDIGLQLDQFLLEGYSKGAIQIEIAKDEEKVGVLQRGGTTPLGRIQFVFKGDDPASKPSVLMEVQDGVLCLVADGDVIEDSINMIGNGVLNKSEFEGSDEDLDKTQRCVPTIQEMILKRC